MARGPYGHRHRRSHSPPPDGGADRRPNDVASAGNSVGPVEDAAQDELARPIPRHGRRQCHSHPQRSGVRQALRRRTQPASSGRTSGRHRLSRSGGRAANSALYIVAIVRMRRHEPTASTSNAAPPKA
ncbi:transposase [Agromyces bracchium]|uniref:transposase n=1 Tax=Agromyces bracchium TaxID=88376 RepID=UPI0035EB983B